MGFEPQVLQEQRIHRAFEADMHLADFAFGDHEHADPEETQAIEQPGDVLLVTGQAVEAFRQDDVEPPARRRSSGLAGLGGAETPLR
jgi:hypothetical protein